MGKMDLMSLGAALRRVFLFFEIDSSRADLYYLYAITNRVKIGLLYNKYA